MKPVASTPDLQVGSATPTLTTVQEPSLPRQKQWEERWGLSFNSHGTRPHIMVQIILAVFLLAVWTLTFWAYMVLIIFGARV